MDAIIVPCALAEEIARLWPVEGCGTALDLALVEGFAGMNAERHEWDAPGSEFLPWRADTRD